MKKIEEYLSKLIKDTTWKAPLVAGVVCFILAALLQSGLVQLILALIHFALVVLGLILLAYAVYLGWPIWYKKLKEQRKN